MNDHAVADSTCLIGLERIGQLDLLRHVFPVVYIPPPVEAEVGYTMEWLIVTPAHDAAVVKVLKTQVDDGEAHVIALALELGDPWVILDDKKARQIAQRIGLRVIGTVGIVLRARRQGSITEVMPILRALSQAGFHMTDTLYREALRLAGEGP